MYWNPFSQVRQSGSRAERKAWCSSAAAASPTRLRHNASKPWQRCRQRGEEESEPSGGRHDCRRRPRSWQQREEQRDRKRGGRDRQRRQLESSRWRRVPARPRRSLQFRYFFFLEKCTSTAWNHSQLWMSSYVAIKVHSVSFNALRSSHQWSLRRDEAGKCTPARDHLPIVAHSPLIGLCTYHHFATLSWSTYLNLRLLYACLD